MGANWRSVKLKWEWGWGWERTVVPIPILILSAIRHCNSELHA